MHPRANLEVWVPVLIVAETIAEKFYLPLAPVSYPSPFINTAGARHHGTLTRSVFVKPATFFSKITSIRVENRLPLISATITYRFELRRRYGLKKRKFILWALSSIVYCFRLLFQWAFYLHSLRLLLLDRKWLTWKKKYLLIGWLVCPREYSLHKSPNKSEMLVLLSLYVFI